MASKKTKPKKNDVKIFLNGIDNDQQRKDSLDLLEIMGDITGEPAKIWRSSIIGFGTYHYKYNSGREGNWFLTGFSPRKRNLSLYIMGGFDQYNKLLQQLGKYKTGKSCLYVNKLDDIDVHILRKLIEKSVSYMKDKYPSSAN